MTAAQTPLEARLARFFPRLSPRRQTLFRAILEDPDETFFLSSRKLADRLKVDPATLVRAVQALGYAGFAEFAVDLREHFVQRITPFSQFQAVARSQRPLDDLLRQCVQKDLNNLSLLEAQLEGQPFAEAAEVLHRAHRRLVVGVDLAASLAGFLAYGLTTLGLDAEAPLGGAGLLQHKVRSLEPGDVLVAISFRRCLKVTVDALLGAKDRGVATLAVTDSPTTPLARFADRSLLASIASPSFTGSYAAPMALLNSLLVACAHLRPEASLASLAGTQAEYEQGARWYQDS
jgi:RpiR family transcriptional regulator, carbohydrate utilization regulator